MLRLFGSGSEILEAGRQRRSILRFNPYQGPFKIALRLIGGWDFAIYRYDCNPGILTEQDVEELWQGAVLQCVRQRAPRLEELTREHGSHPAVLLAPKQA